MAVFTKINSKQAQKILNKFEIGSLYKLTGISAGIENTNYFLETNRNKYILTIFERLGEKQLSTYLQLMSFLAKELPIPKPVKNINNKNIIKIQKKPAAIFTYLEGSSAKRPSLNKCYNLGIFLSKLHIQSKKFDKFILNKRGTNWIKRVGKVLYPFLDTKQQNLLKKNIKSNHKINFIDLPSGPIHADLFRDNVFFKKNKIAGVIDFYFSCTAPFIYDIAICINDWCTTKTGELNQGKLNKFLNGYQEFRELDKKEIEKLPYMIRTSALRFWISRLYDSKFPRKGSILMEHNPVFFENILEKNELGKIKVISD